MFKQNFIIIKLRSYVRRRLSSRRPYGRRDYLRYKEQARALAEAKVLQWNQQLNFPLGSIRIKNQATRWGSCSKKGNLNFNYKIVYLPIELLDYLVVHELCHLKELNHSVKFWALVESVLPNYKSLRSRLRNFRLPAAAIIPAKPQ